MNAVSLLSLAAAAAAAASPPQAQDAVPVARAFLTAFASDPQATRKLATDDALFVFIDMGGPYADALKGLGDKKTALAACNLDSLEQTATPSADELKGYPAPSFKTPGRFASLRAVYSCKRPDGGTALVDVSLIVKNNLVVMFGLVPRRGTLMPPK